MASKQEFFRTVVPENVNVEQVSRAVKQRLLNVCLLEFGDSPQVLAKSIQLSCGNLAFIYFGLLAISEFEVEGARIIQENACRAGGDFMGYPNDIGDCLRCGASVRSSEEDHRHEREGPEIP
jgi:hypothetical protein